MEIVLIGSEVASIRDDVLQVVPRVAAIVISVSAVAIDADRVLHMPSAEERADERDCDIRKAIECERCLYIASNLIG